LVFFEKVTRSMKKCEFECLNCNIVYVYTYTYTYTCIHICIHTYIYICMCVWSGNIIFIRITQSPIFAFFLSRKTRTIKALSTFALQLCASQDRNSCIIVIACDRPSRHHPRVQRLFSPPLVYL